jgi:hypothetical protein
VRCDHAFVEVLIRGIADEKRNAFGQVGGNASGQVDWHFAGSAIDARSACLLPQQSMTTRSLLNAAVKCGVSCFIFSLAAAVFRERQGDLHPRHRPKICLVQVLIWLEKPRYSGQGVVSL